jgi:hypothetical protein
MIMAAQRPKVGIGPHRLDYLLYAALGRRMTIEQMLARLPEAREIADVQGQDFTSEGSTAIGTDPISICSTPFASPPVQRLRGAGY